MYRLLGEARLTTGERLELGVVETPDASWSDRIVPFLLHKGGDWIYQSFGFRSVEEGSGYMCWEATPNAVRDYLAPADATVRPLRWSDWAGYMLASIQPVDPSESLPRSPALDAVGLRTVEGTFLA